MDFVFMLTCADRTVDDALEVLGSLRGAGLRHVGWKDVGATAEQMRELREEARIHGAVTYLEMVALDEQAEQRGAETAARVGIDVLLGGTHVRRVTDVLRGTGIRYYPFVGIPVGHPTDLRGDAAKIEADCKACVEAGCAGVDLLAYRAVEAEPIVLVRAARAALGSDGKLLCAGSIGSPGQLDDLAAAGCDAFTVGTAVFERSFDPARDTVAQQLASVAAALAQTSTRSGSEGALPRS